MGPRDVDGDLVQSPHHRSGAGGGGEAARVAVVLTHVALRQQVRQRERLDFSRLALREDAQPQVRTQVQTTETACGE